MEEEGWAGGREQKEEAHIFVSPSTEQQLESLEGGHFDIPVQVRSRQLK